MFAIVAVTFESFQALPPFEFKLMAAALRYVNRQGECCPSLHQLAADVLVSEATVSRAMARLEQRGCFTRERQGNGRYLYRIAERFLTRRRRRAELVRHRSVSYIPPATDPAGGLAPVQDGLSHGARQEVSPSSDQRSSEGEQQPSLQDEIPSGWEEAAAAERRLAGLAPVNLQREWRALVNHVEGQPVTLWRWRGWVLKARGDGNRSDDTRDFRGSTQSLDVTASTPSPDGRASMPGDESQQRHARDWVRSGFWLRNGAWGPAPDQPGCTLPAALVRWCLRERAAAAA